jgi:hypothetical protein
MISPFLTVWKFLNNRASYRDYLEAMREIEYCNVCRDIRNASYNLTCCVNAKEAEWRNRALNYLVKMWNNKNNGEAISIDEPLARENIQWQK